MAFCGIEFKEVETDYGKPFNHRLKNKKAFSTVTHQWDICSKEGLLIKKENDDPQDSRIKIEFHKEIPVPVSFVSICQLAANVNDSVEGIGSCDQIIVNGVFCVLTCAHNLASKSHLTGKFLNHKVGYAYQMRQGEDAWDSLWRLKANETRVHPKYNGDASCGFDIAVSPIVSEAHEFDRRVKHGKVFKDAEWDSADPDDLKVGYEVEVAGYPGDKAGYPHYLRGKIVSINKTDEGGHILFYNVDTTPGNSGSPISIVDERFLGKERKKRGITKLTIGVHTGHSAVDKLNFGTLITPELRKWIKDMK